MNSQTVRPLCPAVITLPVIAIGASTAVRAQAKSFDGAYKGSFECEPMTAVSGVFRVPLSIIVRHGRVIAAFYSWERSGPVQAGGTVDPDGVFRFGLTEYTQKYSFRGDYSGTLSATGGTLTGTQVLTCEITGDGATRTCEGTFSRVDLPRQ